MCRTATDAHDQRWIYDGTEGNISKDAVLERLLGRDRHTLLLAGSSEISDDPTAPVAKAPCWVTEPSEEA